VKSSEEALAVRIGELAARTGVPTRLLRYYEEQRLLFPARDERGWRSYDGTDQVRVDEIRLLLGSGLPTSAIEQLIGCLGHGSGFPQHGVNEQLRTELIGVRERLDARIHCLARNRDALNAWLEALPPASADDADAEGFSP
jgi:DNA-binding transcriptional MerR regulator